MGTATFEKGAIVLISGKRHELKRVVSEGIWQLEESKTGRIFEKTLSALRTLYADRELTFELEDDRAPAERVAMKIGKPDPGISEDDLEEAKIRSAYATAAASVPATKQALITSIQGVWESLKKPEIPPHWTTVYRWRTKLINAGRDIRGVVSNHGRRGNRTRRYPDTVLAIVERCIESVYLTRERHTTQDVIDKAVLEVHKENRLRPEALRLPEPTRRLVTSMISEVPAFDRYAARYGRGAAAKRFRTVLGHRTTDAPLERAEIDHTPMDLMVIDDESGLPLGRPYLTACIDDCSRCVLGIHVSFEPPSALSVARCLKNAFMPKTALRKEFPDIVNEWSAHGVMRELSMDNGLEFHAQGLESACGMLGIELHYSPRKTPWFKGKIERWLRTINAEVAHTAPGSTFSNIFERDDYDASKHAVVRLSTLQTIVRKWIVDVYHQRPHRALSAPPEKAWQSGIVDEDIPLPEDPDQLDAILGRRVQRVLTHKGVEVDGLLYNSPEMATLRRELGEKLDVDVCIDGGDIGKIVVLLPTKSRMFIVPALAQKYAAGLSAWQHKVIKRYAAAKMEKYDSTAWLEAKEAIAEMVRQEFRLQKARGAANKRAARYKNAGTAKPPVEDGEAPSPAPANPAGAESLLSEEAATTETSAGGTHQSECPEAGAIADEDRPRLEPLKRQRVMSHSSSVNRPA